MAVGYRSSSVSGGSDSLTTSKAIPVPAGAAVGDVALVALEMWESANPTVTPPAGFTLITQLVSGNQKIKVWWKRLTTAETGSWTFSWSGQQWNMGHAILMTGAIASGDPIGANFNTATAASGTTIPSTSVTTAFVPGLVHFVATEEVTNVTPPTGHTEVQDGDYLETSYRLPAGSGTHTASGGTLSTSSLSFAVLVAIEPAAAGGAVALDGVSSAAAHATGSVSVTRPITGAASAAASVTAALSTTRTVTGSTSAAADHAGTVAVARGMAGVTAATVELTGDLTISGQVTFDGDITAAGHLTGVLSATRPLTGLGTAAVDLAGTLDRRPGFAASSSTAADLSAEVVVGRGLAAAGSATADLTGQLTVTRSLAGVVSMAGDAAGALTTAPLVTRGRSFLLTRTAPAAAPAGNRAAQGTLLDRTVPSSRGGT